MAELSDEHKALGYMLQTPGWNGLYMGKMLEEARILNARLLDPSQKRKDSQSDDFLRGAIFAIKRALEWPDEEMTMAAAELLARASTEPVIEDPLVGGSRPSYDDEEATNGRA